MLPIRLKEGVKLSQLTPHSVLAIMITASIYERLGADEFVVTSGSDGKHKHNSKHYVGDAFDCRIWTLPKDHREVAAKLIQDALGDDFDVLFKPTHIHVEYDPTRAES